MLLYKIKKTFINFINSPGWTLHFFVMKFINATGLNRSQRINSFFSRLAQLFDRGVYQKWIIPKILRFLARNHKRFIFFDHFLKRYFFINKSPLTPLINKLLQKSYLELDYFTPEQFPLLDFVEVNAGKKELQISWAVHNKCNFYCSYCNSSIRDRAGEFTFNANSIRKKFHTLSNYYKRMGIETVEIILTGGEPTIWAPLKEACEIMREEFGRNFSSVNIIINTNLSRDITWWRENYSLFNFIIASFHPRSADTQNFIDILKYLDDKIAFSVNVMVLESEIDKILDLTKKIRELPYYHYQYLPLLDIVSSEGRYLEYGERAKKLYEEGDLFAASHFPVSIFKNGISTNFIKDSIGIRYQFTANHMFANKLNKFKGWHCSVGQSIFINGDGYMHHASCNAIPPIGNIFDDNSLLFEKYSIQCPFDYCLCGTDILIPKTKLSD